MLGEAWNELHNAKSRLVELKDQLETFRLWGEENLHPFLFEKRLKEIEDEIARCENEVEQWEDIQQELIDSEVKDSEEPSDEEIDSFRPVFDELCQIPGIKQKDI